jgi:hypothetical protein
MQLLKSIEIENNIMNLIDFISLKNRQFVTVNDAMLIFKIDRVNILPSEKIIYRNGPVWVCNFPRLKVSAYSERKIKPGIIRDPVFISVGIMNQEDIAYTIC